MTVESKEAYYADPSADASTRKNGYPSSSDDSPSSSDTAAYKWDVARKRNVDRLRPLKSNSDSHNTVGSPTFLAVPNSSSDHHDSSQTTANGMSRTLSPSRRHVQLPAENGSNVHGRTLVTQTISARNTLAPPDKKFAADKRNSSDGSPAGKQAPSRTVLQRYVYRRLRVNPTIEALLVVAASSASYYGLRTHERLETQSHASEVGLITVLSSIYFWFRDPQEQAAIWATDYRNYRSCPEDGAIIALLMPPLLACASLFSAIQDQAASPRSTRASGEALPNPPWLVDGPLPILSHQRKLPGGMTALILSRYSLVSMMCLTSSILLCHLLATKFVRKPHEFPKSNWYKLRSFTAFASVLAVFFELVKEVAAFRGLPLWANLARWEVIAASLLFQANLYAISRLARKSFTLGELGIVAAVGVTLTMETLHLFVAKLLPVTTPYIKTFRRPTPLLIFQLALIVGTFMAGFLLSPLLYLSRNLAQKPTHRLRWPDKRNLHRKLLAAFFYLFTVLYIVGVVGMWIRWLLYKRDPWLWTASFLLKGRQPWSRPALIGYWILLISISISGWQAVVANAKRFRSLGSQYNRLQSANSGNVSVAVVPSSDAPGGAEVTDASKRNSGIAINLNALGGSATAIAKEHNTAAIKRAAHLSLNARRKFFHALAVVLFVPGIAWDPAFTHLAFSVAFSAFVFAEYVRYYALYPFGATLHVFMSEFLDHKDSGPVILSHFYLLTGCAGPLWLEGNSRIMQQTGVLVLGIGDALASVVGRRYGRLTWPGGSSKTVEGTMAFFFSIVLSAWALRAVGLCEQFALTKYSFVIAVLGLLEGVSDQHDNLILPIFAFVVASLVGL